MTCACWTERSPSALHEGSSDGDDTELPGAAETADGGKADLTPEYYEEQSVNNALLIEAPPRIEAGGGAQPAIAQH